MHVNKFHIFLTNLQKCLEKNAFYVRYKEGFPTPFYVDSLIEFKVIYNRPLCQKSFEKLDISKTKNYEMLVDLDLHQCNTRHIIF